jgi:uncharacterized DUF497 family protein
MKIEFDPAKDVLNRKRHGLPLALASELEWEIAQVWLDRRFLYDELRLEAVVPKGLTFYHVAYVEQGEAIRVISLRLATRREAIAYVENS